MAFSISGGTAALVALGTAPVWAVMPMLAVIGFGGGLAGPSRDLLVRAAAPANATGRVYGVVYSGMDIGLAISPPIFGALMDSQHPGWVFALIGAFQFIALATAVGVGERALRVTQPA